MNTRKLMMVGSIASSNDSRNKHKRENGTALLVSVLMLTLMGIVGMASLDTVMRDRQMAGNSSRARSALYAADAGVAAALDAVRTASLPPALAPGDCIAAPVPETNLPNGSLYRPDTTAANTNVCMIASADPCSELDASIEVGSGSVFLYTLWDMRMQGETADGAVARVQATSQRCHAFN
jgi:Tfp pilus assembly protein PilX